MGTTVANYGNPEDKKDVPLSKKGLKATTMVMDESTATSPSLSAADLKALDELEKRDAITSSLSRSTRASRKLRKAQRQNKKVARRR